MIYSIKNNNFVYFVIPYSAKVKTDIPDSFFSLTNLQLLDLSKNHIKYIPNCISSLTNLETLYLFNNKITDI